MIVKEQGWEMQGAECPAGELYQFSQCTATESLGPVGEDR